MISKSCCVFFHSRSWKVNLRESCRQKYLWKYKKWNFHQLSLLKLNWELGKLKKLLQDAKKEFKMRLYERCCSTSYYAMLHTAKAMVLSFGKKEDNSLSYITMPNTFLSCTALRTKEFEIRQSRRTNWLEVFCRSSSTWKTMIVQNIHPSRTSILFSTTLFYTQGALSTNKIRFVFAFSLE